MDLKPTKPLSGFIELLPAQQRCFDFCAARMLSVLKTAGFNQLDLPAIERAEVLTDKDNWDEIETQMFLFQKGDTKMGLRYDGTVGLSRYVAGHLNDLTFPFRASQFSKRYRGERAQRGRYREFYQMDMDIMGINSLSTNYDAEIIAVIQRTLNSVSEFIGDNCVRVGSRPFWDALFDYLEMTDIQKKDVFVLIDKKDKMGDADFAALEAMILHHIDEALLGALFTTALAHGLQGTHIAGDAHDADIEQTCQGGHRRADAAVVHQAAQAFQGEGQVGGLLVIGDLLLQLYRLCIGTTQEQQSNNNKADKEKYERGA